MSPRRLAVALAVSESTASGPYSVASVSTSGSSPSLDGTAAGAMPRATKNARSSVGVSARAIRPATCASGSLLSVRSAVACTSVS